ncbi:MAG: DUF1326 domain-containing protein [Nitrososphaeraceae archaeon]|jgi:hypothetical protein
MSYAVQNRFQRKKKRSITIPSFAKMEIEGLTGSDPTVESKVINPAFSNTPGDDPIIARSTTHTYKDHGLEWDNSGRNAFYSRITYFP